MPTSPIINLVGQRYGDLVVLRLIPDLRIRKSTAWECRCDCGNEKIASSHMLRSGHCKSCGCRNARVATERSTKHGMAGSPTLAAWKDMKRRCLNPKATNYSKYGGRGITVCERWMVFENFLVDMGPRPKGPAPRSISLERINNEGNYEPGNCKWATALEQGNNTRRNRLVEIDGKCQTVSQWAREVGVSRFLVRDRLNRGMSPREAVFGSAA